MSGMKIMEYHQNKKDYNFISSSDNKVNEKNSTNNNLEKWSAIGLFQTPLYIAEGYEINQNIVEETTSIIEKPGRVRKNEGNNFSDNIDIFNSLNFEEYPEYEKIKKYCQSHLNNYVKEILCPIQEDVEFYFTQSWVNITRPGEFHHRHSHQNSIISGIFYLNAVKNDNVNFYHPMGSLFHQNQFEPTQWNIFNSSRYSFSPRNGDLLLFPSWLDHSVEKNHNQTKYDRISLSFNTFARGSFGRTRDLNALHLS
tara:strand:+ start:833 stop:1594 length:762 start_codon:yes stop_codon:yes gene_type:complete